VKRYRLLAIGDVHGFKEPLRALLDEVSPTSTDTLVFLGDYVDKGPDVAGTIELLLALQQKANCIFLRGNHDRMLVDAYREPTNLAVWVCLAGEQPLASYGSGPTEDVLRSVPETHIEFLEKTCRNFFETKEYLFVHGGIREHVYPKDEDEQRLLWTTLSLATPHRSGRTVICGHSAQRSGQIADLGHTICIDTGIAKGMNLTCLNLTDFSFTQVSQSLKVKSGQLREKPTHKSGCVI
jgi:serine/threonine protein phosphatase 1